MTAQELIAKVLELDANSTQEFDIDLGRIDILVDEFERTGKFKNHAKADNFLKRLKLAEAAPILARLLQKAIEQRDAFLVLLAEEREGNSLSQIVKDHIEGTIMDADAELEALINEAKAKGER